MVTAKRLPACVRQPLTIAPPEPVRQDSTPIETRHQPHNDAAVAVAGHQKSLGIRTRGDSGLVGIQSIVLDRSRCSRNLNHFGFRII